MLPGRIERGTRSWLFTRKSSEPPRKTPTSRHVRFTAVALVQPSILVPEYVCCTWFGGDSCRQHSHYSHTKLSWHCLCGIMSLILEVQWCTWNLDSQLWLAERCFKINKGSHENCLQSVGQQPGKTVEESILFNLWLHIRACWFMITPLVCTGWVGIPVISHQKWKACMNVNVWKILNVCLDLVQLKSFSLCVNRQPYDILRHVIPYFHETFPKSFHG